MTDVFISYARDDRAEVRRLAEAVKQAGYSVWWDDELPPHLAYGEVITEKIEAAKAAIVVWSAKAAASEWVRAEADVARNGKKLIQLSLDEKMPPLPFNQLHFVSIAGWMGEEDHPGWQKVKQSLATLTGRAPSERPLHPIPPTPPPAATAPRKGRGLLFAAIALAAMVAAAIGLFVLSRAEETAPVASVTAVPDSSAIPPPPPVARDAISAVPPPRAEPASEARPAPPRPAARSPKRPPAELRTIRRYCMGPGRGTPECRRPRQYRDR